MVFIKKKCIITMIGCEIMKIGLRTIKTAIAVTLCVIVANIFNFEYPFFMGMTAIISMDKTMTNSLKMGRNRIFGTFLGACIGIALSYIDRGNALLCGVGVIILIQLCNLFKLQGAITIGGIVMIAIMVHTDKTPMYYGYYRTLHTLMGASISFIVNMTIFPYSTIDRLEKRFDDLWIEIYNIIDELKKYNLIPLNDFNEKLKLAENEIHLYRQEIVLNKKKIVTITALEQHYDIAAKILLELQVCETIDAEKDKIIYDYHLNKAIELYENPNI